MHTAATFFGLTQDAHLYCAQMYAAKLHDKTKGTITIRSVLNRAKQEAGRFSNASAEEVRVIVANAEIELAELEKTLTALEYRRNESLAHLDVKTILDPTALDKDAALTVDELNHLFVETGNILNDISQALDGSFSVLGLVDADDLETPLRLIAEAKCAQADQYEREFNERWPHERPAICQKS